jgi:hypothetical protein
MTEVCTKLKRMAVYSNDFHTTGYCKIIESLQVLEEMITLNGRGWEGHESEDSYGCRDYWLDYDDEVTRQHAYMYKPKTLKHTSLTEEDWADYFKEVNESYGLVVEDRSKCFDDVV